MQEVRSIPQEAAEDVSFGQVVMIWARWFLIAAGVLLTLWVATEADKLAFAIIPVVALVTVNFYLHGRYLTERPANAALITVVGLIDLAIITTAVLVWPGGSKGIFSPFFVLYFPVIMAFAFVMPRKATVVFTGLTVVAYVGASLFAEVVYPPKHLYPTLYEGTKARVVAASAIVSAPVAPVGSSGSIATDQGPTGAEPPPAVVAKAETEASRAVRNVTLSSGYVGTVKGLVMRLITLVAMGALGSYYWRIQRDRRRSAMTEALPSGTGEVLASRTDPDRDRQNAVSIDLTHEELAGLRSGPESP